MIRGLYTAASGLILGLRRQEVVADNLANIATPGYKGETSAAAAFESVLARSVGNEPIPIPLTFQRRLGVVGTGAYQDARGVDMSGGTLNASGRMLDLGISGPGFFVVGTPDGPRYTRDGRFEADATGRLVTGDGDPLLGLDGGPISVTGDEVIVLATGEVVVDGETRGTLQTVELDPTRIIRARGTQFEIAIGAAPVASAPSAATQIRQGMLEEANVDIARAATNMLANQRTFGANQTVFSTTDETLAQAVRDVGRVG